MKDNDAYFLTTKRQEADKPNKTQADMGFHIKRGLQTAQSLLFLVSGWPHLFPMCSISFYLFQFKLQQSNEL